MRSKVVWNLDWHETAEGNKEKGNGPGSNVCYCSAICNVIGVA